MTICLSDAGKRFNRDWIFRHFNYTFEAGQSYAITGPNGSGKSTLLQALSGNMYINEGKIEYKLPDEPSNIKPVNRQLTTDNIYTHVSICAPYLEVVEEMTLTEFLNFHHGFKPFLPGVTTNHIISTIGLQKAVNKQIRNYSSGMKQRVKLAQCIFSDTAIVLLDEPCTNLDSEGIELYHRLIDHYCKYRLVVVSSNDEVEYRFCKEKINISDYKY
ncbi:MAG: ATP-binding cassette domain-containing protein [Bacteroidota bacterium]|nr:ATP-binding cassette domain-containing protein [Bacteroidota bacterium]